MIADSPGRTGMPNSAEETADAAVAAVEAAAAVGLCDPERAVLAGRSSGGHAVTLALTATDRFRAAITCSGPYNLTSWFGALRVVGHGKVDLPGAGLAAVGGRPWDAGHRCDLSPVFAVDSITTPLLLVHGALDTRVPVGQSDELFTALTVLNRPVTYFRAPDEEHSEWRPDAQARLLATTLEFLQKYTDSSSPGDARQKRLFAPIRG
ncbi:MAG: prolyl oligopeptidase family serine peptidase [Acidimicrobiia bacterium]|nr:prolyl oligopeptidase family serine peptidase [Acidimicrobiia bacterium]